MTEEEATLLMIKGSIADLPPDMQENVKQCVARINEVLAEYPNGEGLIALGLRCAEFAAK